MFSTLKVLLTLVSKCSRYCAQCNTSYTVPVSVHLFPRGFSGSNVITIIISLNKKTMIFSRTLLVKRNSHIKVKIVKVNHVKHIFLWHM